MIYDIIVFGGQSNMQGQSEALTEDREVRGAFEYRLLSDTLVPLKNPVGEDVKYDGSCGYRYFDNIDAKEWLKEHVLGSSCCGHTNLVPEFCREYVKTAGRGAVAVHAAKGSTEIDDWMKGTPGYEFIVKKTLSAANALKRAGQSQGRIFFVWLQGESDAIFSKPMEEYKTKLFDLADGLKADMGLERFGIIEVGRFTNDARDDEIINAQEAAAKERPEMFVILTDHAKKMGGEPGMMRSDIAGHYSAAGLEVLGREGGRKLGEVSNI